MTTAEGEATLPRPRRPARAALLMLGKIALAVVGVWLVVKAIRAVDWGQVGDALGRLSWLEIVAIAALLGVRQFVNSATLPVLIRGLSIPHALSTALSGTLIQTFTPPPSDTVLRSAMLTSYGVERTRAAAALVLDTIVFYLARFIAPIIGLVLTVTVVPAQDGSVWMAVIGIVVAALLVWALVMIAKGESAASKLGRFAGGLVRRLRPTVDPEGWALAVVRFQRESAAGLFGKLLRATPIMLGFILVDAIVLALSLRFVGIPGADIRYLAVIAAMFSMYPLTIFPFSGIGVMDAALIVLLNAEGVVDQPDMVAAMVIWRAATIILPLLPGVVALLLWRGRQSTPAPQTE